MTLAGDHGGLVGSGVRMPWIQTEPEMGLRKLCRRRCGERSRGIGQCSRRQTCYAASASRRRDRRRCRTRSANRHRRANRRNHALSGSRRHVRKAYATWGSKKILWTLDRERQDEDWPARSTVDEILRRAGVVEPRGRRPRRQPSSPPKAEAKAPSDVWSMDHGLQGLVPCRRQRALRSADGQRCAQLGLRWSAERW